MDVRGIDGEPFDVVTALERPDDEETVTLIDSFEPGPLDSALEGRGCEYRTSGTDPDVCEVESNHA